MKKRKYEIKFRQVEYNQSCKQQSSSTATKRWKHVTLTAESTTAQLACCSLGVTRSTIFSASRASAALYLERASNIKTWPHLKKVKVKKNLDIHQQEVAQAKNLQEIPEKFI